MHWLGLALYAEGRTDYYFLSPLLRRLCEDLCHGASQAVEINESVLGLDTPRGCEQLPREQRIVEAARQASGAWNVLFVHADGANDPRAKRAEQVTPALELIHGNALGHAVAVVPIRETEAWAIADGNAIRAALGVTHDDRALGLPVSTDAAEGEADPKAVLDRACGVVRRGRRNVGGASNYLQTIGEQMSLDRLRRMRGFAALEADLRAALVALNLLR